MITKKPAKFYGIAALVCLGVFPAAVVSAAILEFNEPYHISQLITNFASLVTLLGVGAALVFAIMGIRSFPGKLAIGIICALLVLLAVKLYENHRFEQRWRAHVRAMRAALPNRTIKPNRHQPGTAP